MTRKARITIHATVELEEEQMLALEGYDPAGNLLDEDGSDRAWDDFSKELAEGKVKLTDAFCTGFEPTGK